jgi:hypothetical protein
MSGCRARLEGDEQDHEAEAAEQQPDGDADAGQCAVGGHRAGAPGARRAAGRQEREWTSWPPTTSATPSTRRCSTARCSPEQRPLRLLGTARPRALRRLGQGRRRRHITGIKYFRHPVVGDLDLTYDRLDLVADPGLTIFTYTAEPGSKHEQALNLLGSWAATLEAENVVAAADAQAGA